MLGTTMQTTAASPTTPSLTTVSHGNNNSPIAGSMPSSKTDWLKEPSEHHRRRKQLLHAMARWRAVDLALCAMHCGMKCIFITLCLFWKMEFHD
eukprot:CCRYP_010799-RA/>CCRYP_010799-RA protein AED:0.31 eAED:1.00 QI:0/-1/0/1/-1/0/1/0/93